MVTKGRPAEAVGIEMLAELNFGAPDEEALDTPGLECWFTAFREILPYHDNLNQTEPIQVKDKCGAMEALVWIQRYKKKWNSIWRKDMMADAAEMLEVAGF